MPEDTTASTLAQIIRGDSGVDLTPIHDYLTSRMNRTRAHGEGLVPAIEAPSVEVEGVVVRVSVQVSDPSYLGTFDRAAGTQMVQLFVNARVSGDAADGPAERGAHPVDLPVREQIAWARAVLADLADYAYRVLSDASQLRVRPSTFVAFVDDTTPRLAPSDFIWLLVCGGRRAYPEKIVPENPELLSRLKKYGDMIKADRITHPQAPSSPAVWAAEFVSELTATIADELGRLGNDRWFTFDEISLHSSTRVVVRYTWHLLAGDKAYGFDIDLAGVREQRLRERDDSRPRLAARSIGATPFGQPVFRSQEVIDGVTWIHFGGTTNP